MHHNNDFIHNPYLSVLFTMTMGTLSVVFNYFTSADDFVQFCVHIGQLVLVFLGSYAAYTTSRNNNQKYNDKSGG